MQFFEKYGHRGIKQLSDNKNSPEMNDSEVDPIARKNPDEKYYFFVEKSQFQNLKKFCEFFGFFRFFFAQKPVTPVVTTLPDPLSYADWKTVVEFVHEPYCKVRKIKISKILAISKFQNRFSPRKNNFFQLGFFFA